VKATPADRFFIAISDTHPPQIFPGFLLRLSPAFISMAIVIVVQQPSAF